MHPLIVLVGLLLLGAWLPAAAQASDVIRVAQAEPTGEPAGTGSDTSTPPATRRPKPPADDIEEIVVQAGESESAADLQAGDSVTGFNASDLEALGAQSIDDLAGFTPNLEIVTTGATTPTFFIRGVGLNDFAANSSGSVAIYQDDVPKNSPALQLPTLFDVEAVNILRGPQGTGNFRSASAGAIKIYGKKPTGDFNGYLRSEYGNYNFLDFEGAIGAPIVEDYLSGRFAFRFTERDGYTENRCGDAIPRDQRPLVSPPNTNNDLIHILTPAVAAQLTALNGANNPPIRPGASVCGETVYNSNVFNPNLTRPKPGLDNLNVPSDGRSFIPVGLPTEVNDLGNWATRATLRFQPTLDQDWLLTGQFSKRNQYSPLGQAYGTSTRSEICDFSNDASLRPFCHYDQTFGSPDATGYQTIENLVQRRLLNPCRPDIPIRQSVVLAPCTGPGVPTNLVQNLENQALQLVQAGLGNLDEHPHEGDYDYVGRTKNDVWGVSLRGDVALSDSLNLKTVTAYDTYNRTLDQDLDFSPNKLFSLLSDDDGWQVVEDVSLSGVLPGLPQLSWNAGAYGLVEKLSANTFIDLPRNSAVGAVRQRVWEQDLLSLGGYLGFSLDFWEDFTLDGGARYNWEEKEMDISVYSGNVFRQNDFEDRDIWQDPTGQIRLTYRFREDTHAYMKFSRGWKGGHYNVTVNQLRGITKAEPESINSFEGGLKGSWFSGRLSLDGSIFHYDYENYQIFTVEIPLLGNPEFVVLNANDAEVYGAEVELVGRPLPGTFLQVRGAWLESAFDSFIQNQAVTRSLPDGQSEQIVTERDSSGNTLLNSPQFTVSLTAEQTIPLSRYGSLTLRWDGNWTDDTYYDSTEGKGLGTFDGKQFLPNDTIGQSAYWLHNFSVDYRTPDGSITLGAFVRNAFDEVYKSFAFDASGLATNRTVIFFVGEPRMYGGSFSVTF